MYTDGNTLDQISKYFNCTPSNIHYWLKKYGCIKSNILTKCDNLDEWLYENTLTRTGINNHCEKRDWWLNRDVSHLYNELFERTKKFNPYSISERIYLILNKIEEVPKCLICSNQVKFKTFKSGYRKYCSIKCSTKSSNRNSKISKNRDFDKINEKIKKTNNEKYGVDYFFQSDIFFEKSKKTKKELYGNENYNNVEKNKQTCLIRYGIESLFRNTEYQDYMRGCKLKKYGDNFPYFKDKNSKAENEVREYLNQIGFNFKQNRTILNNAKELDGYCELNNFAFEYCGLYWHSEQYKDNNYHYNKFLESKLNGVHLLTIFEDEWLYKNEQIKSFISARMGKFDHTVYARKTEFHEINKKESSDFFENYHIQGSPNSTLKAYGLYDNDNLISCVSFSKHHRNNNEIVLNRLAFKSGIQIVGGASKIISNAIKKIDCDQIITWSDNRWSTGEIYLKCGFEFSGDIRPDYSYVYKQKRLSKQSQKKSNTGCPKNITEHEWAKQNNLYRIYDCGKKRWIFNKR